MDRATRDAEEGFTLIELLVVIIIIGILAAIAIPLLNNKKDRAKRAAMVADLRQTAIHMETYYTDYEAYPPDLASLGGVVRPSPGDTVALVSSSAQAFCLSATNTGLGETRYYQSDAGGLLARGAVCT